MGRPAEMEICSEIYVKESILGGMRRERGEREERENEDDRPTDRDRPAARRTVSFFEGTKRGAAVKTVGAVSVATGFAWK